MKRAILSAIIFLGVYTLFWMRFFAPATVNVSEVPSFGTAAHKQVSEVSKGETLQETQVVLGSSSEPLPQSFNIAFIPRRQQFGLSCEFSAAASVIYHYTGRPDFSVSNSLDSEKQLISEVGVSNNPNLGIRMGSILPDSFDALYQNLNQKFGGGDYYGVHAAPFVDVFVKYGLTSKFISKDNFVEQIKQAIYNGHVVMTWIKIGYSKPIDLSMTYGSVAVVRGEHVVIIHGYDQSGFWAMDPATATNRYIPYKSLADAISDFNAPFLEVYPLSKKEQSIEETVEFGKATGLKRENLSISILNTTRKIGAGDQLAGILRDFGYKINSLESTQKSDTPENLTIQIKKGYKDYLYILSRDLQAANYQVASISADLDPKSLNSAIITLGEF